MGIRPGLELAVAVQGPADLRGMMIVSRCLPAKGRGLRVRPPYRDHASAQQGEECTTGPVSAESETRFDRMIGVPLHDVAAPTAQSVENSGKGSRMAGCEPWRKSNISYSSHLQHLDNFGVPGAASSGQVIRTS